MRRGRTGTSSSVPAWALYLCGACGACGACAACTASCTSTGEPACPASTEIAAGNAVPASGPTWFRDVEPIVQLECTGCHAARGTAGFALDHRTTTSLASLVAERVSARDMPPWPPGTHGARIAASRALDDASIATIVAWAAAGAPAGDPREHIQRAPRVSPSPARSPDLRLELAAGEAYREPVSQFVTDEIRCFVLPLPPGTGATWVTAARWRAGIPTGVHQIGGFAVDAETARAARERSGLDGRAGYECGGGVGQLASLGANGTGGVNDGASMLPPGTAVVIPEGGAVVMRVHYAVKHLARMSDRSSVELWVAGGDEQRRTRPLVFAGVAAPVEVPCPGGLSADPSNPCSRDNAFARLAPGAATEARTRADALLASCGTTLESLAAQAPPPAGDHFLVPTACASAAPVTGTIRTVHARMQTRGAALRVEAERAGGAWTTVLDIPRWRWAFESAYVLEHGVPIEAGRHLRVSCTFDNGFAFQWSALTGEPGHGTLARPPLLSPGYLVTAPHRAAEACTASVGIEAAP